MFLTKNNRQNIMKILTGFNEKSMPDTFLDVLWQLSKNKYTAALLVSGDIQNKLIDFLIYSLSPYSANPEKERSLHFTASQLTKFRQLFWWPVRDCSKCHIDGLIFVLTAQLDEMHRDMMIDVIDHLVSTNENNEAAFFSLVKSEELRVLFNGEDLSQDRRQLLCRWMAMLAKHQLRQNNLPVIDYTQMTQIAALGEGSFSTVDKYSFQVTPMKNQPVAIKFFIENDDYKALKKEALVHQELKHSNIIAALGIYFCQHRLQWGLVLELACTDLSQVIDKNAQDHHHLFSPQWRVNIAQGVLQGLEYLHGKSITHYDIKSPNIFLTLEDCPKIGDFGLSMRGGHASCVGTPEYMAPEVWLKTSQYQRGSAADIWSFGMLLLELFTFRIPWSKYTTQGIVNLSHEQIKNNLQHDKRPSVPREVPDVVSNVIQQCWSSNPASRPKAISAFSQLNLFQNPNENKRLCHADSEGCFICDP